jgi:hypothetical protein
MVMKIVSGIRFREEDLERLAPVLTKALRPSTTSTENKSRKTTVKKTAAKATTSAAE